MSSHHTDASNAVRTIASIMHHLNLPMNPDEFNINEFEKQVLKFAAANKVNASKVLFTWELSMDEWEKFDRYIQLLNNDYENRHELLKKRAEATIDSFLWSERVQQMDKQIRQICDRSQFKQLNFQQVNNEVILAANSDLLIVTKTSAAQLRQGTKVEGVCDFKMPAKNIPDRGGRVEQITPIRRETFHQQEMERTRQQRNSALSNNNQQRNDREERCENNAQQRNINQHRRGGKRGRYF